MVEWTVCISFIFRSSNQEVIQVQIFWALSRPKRVDSIKPKPLPRLKTKRSNRDLFMLLITICSSSGSGLLEKQEVRLKKIQQLTFSGENAEGYFSLDGSMLIYQSHDRDSLCDQIYTMDLSSGETKLVSTGLGATTCAYFEYPKCENIIYASTHLGGRACPPKLDYKGVRVETISRLWYF